MSDVEGDATRPGTERAPEEPTGTEPALDLAAARRFGACRRRILLGASDGDALAARALLAAWGEGPITDAFIAVRAGADHEQLPRLVGHCIRRLAQLDSKLSSVLMSDAVSRWPNHPALNEVLEQLALGAHAVPDRISQLAMVRLEERSIDDALDLLGTSRPDDPVCRHWALATRAAVLRQHRRFRSAATSGRELLEEFPSADDRDQVLFQVCLDDWAEGALAGVPARLLSVAQRPGGFGSGGEARQAVSVLDQIDIDPKTASLGPSLVPLPLALPATPEPGTSSSAAWSAIARAIAGLAALAPAAPLNGEGITSAGALLSAARRSGLRAVMIRLTPDLVTALVAAGVIVCLDATRHGLNRPNVIAGYEPVADVLLIRDPSSPGASWITRSEQQRRCRIDAMTATAVSVSTEGDRLLERLAAEGVHTGEELFVEAGALDRMAGATLAPARAPTESGDLPEGFALWLRDARRRHPGAGWVEEVHARALESAGRHDESVAAWMRAVSLDGDAMACNGLAKGLARTGHPAEARLALRSAFARGAPDVGSLVLLARLTEQDDRDAAGILVDVAVDLDPDDLAALTEQAALAGKLTDPDKSVRALERMNDVDPANLDTAGRLTRRLMMIGRWGAAGSRAASLARSLPEEAAAWQLAAHTAWCRARAEEALETWLAGIRRCGPDSGLVRGAARTVATLFAAERMSEPLLELAACLASKPEAILDAASVLDRHQHPAQAAELTARAMQDPGIEGGHGRRAWRVAQRLSARAVTRGSHHEQIITLLSRAVDAAGTFAPPRILLASHLLADGNTEPASHLLAEAAPSTDYAPALFELRARAAEAAGEPGLAQIHRAQRRSCEPATLLRCAPWLRSVGLAAFTSDLLEEVERELPNHVGVLVQLAFCLRDLGEADAALERLVRAHVLNPRAVEAPPLLDLAEAGGAWELVKQVCKNEIAAATADSRLDTDTWSMQGRLAGVALLDGNGEPRSNLAARASHHPGAWYHLVRIESLLDDEHLEADLDHLTRIAPGSACRIREEGV
ncbi:MAG: hypothetical protein EDR02_13315 [Actinobacteria bacterium]|nr:MAG: hypothetical protein EDR02_13315 [Actinomycetota bacterium]RIK03697.1 MAG: hypothetical protein DCC48_15750 [Acidobacteriota bacterium]